MCIIILTAFFWKFQVYLVFFHPRDPPDPLTCMFIQVIPTVLCVYSAHHLVGELLNISTKYLSNNYTNTWNQTSNETSPSTNLNNLTPPIRQTASIFKQPVTVFKSHETKVNRNWHMNTWLFSGLRVRMICTRIRIRLN